MSERSGNDAAATRGASNADPADAEAAPPKAPTLRLDDDEVFASGRPTGATAAAAGGPMPRSERRSANDRVQEAATRRFPEREAFGAIATKGSSELRDSLKLINLKRLSQLGYRYSSNRTSRE